MLVKEINIADVKMVENSRVTVQKIDELMRDIKQRGLRNAIEVTKTKGGEYVLISGHRRLLACKKLGWKTIDASICEDMEMAQLLIHNLGENTHRESTTPQEDGRIYDRLRKMGLNNGEIAAKLSVPVSHVSKCLDIYLQLPDKYRSRVAYVGSGGAKKGNISATVANKIISIKRNHGLSDAATDKLLETTKMEELGMPELALIGKFLDQGLSVTQSIEKRKDYSYMRTDVVVSLEEMDKLLAKYKMDSPVMLLQAIIYGDLPALKKPDFIKIRQIPDKGSLK